MTLKNLVSFIAVSLAICSCTAPSVWDRTLEKYADDQSVSSLLFVKYTEGSNAEAEFYVRDAEGGWKLDRSGSAHVGKNGIGKEKEGDLKTPEGEIGIRRAFGILPNPGSKVEYLEVKETTYACDEEGEYYNLIIDTEQTGHDCHGEHMSAIAPAYNYGFETNFNDENVYPNGSAIFVHCKGTGTHTGGCIAVDEEFMKYLIMNADLGLKICIHNK